MKWSRREKEIARKAFDAAYERECRAIADEVQEMLASTRDPAGLWRVHNFLTEKLKGVREIYDYRYSVLTMVFGVLLREGWLTREDLDGLSEEKMSRIARIAEMK